MCHRTIDGRTRFFAQKAQSLSLTQRKKMIESNEKLALLRKLDEQYLKTPQYGARSYATWFVRQGIRIGRKRTANMM